MHKTRYKFNKIIHKGFRNNHVPLSYGPNAISFIYCMLDLQLPM